MIQETVWFGDIAVATLKPNGAGGVNVFYVHTDHLNTPRQISRPSDNVVIWRWDSDPFGTTAVSEDPDGDSTSFVYNLRFVGQYFDSETGVHYNYFRDYDPSVGRYVQSDPIGLDGGVNTYAYVDGNPLSFADPFGLTKGGKKNIGTEGFSRNSDPKDVEKALKDAQTKGQKKRASALRGLLKVIKRGGRSIVLPGLIEGVLSEACAQGDLLSCEALCKLDPDTCQPKGGC